MFSAIPGTKVEVSRIGFGCARLFGGSESRSSARLVETALECGIRHFDTAPSYGNGESEAILGAVLRGVPGITVATKVGIPRPTGAPVPWRARWYRRYLRPALARVPKLKRLMLTLSATRQKAASPADAIAVPQRRIEPASLIRELEISLSLLDRSAIDLYLIHEPNQFVIDEDLRAAVESIRQKGLIQAFGLAFGGVASSPSLNVDFVQSLYMPSAESGERTDSANPTTRIFHGVMRQAHHDINARQLNSGPPALIAALKRHPEAVFLFSASSPRQIREVMAAVRDAGVSCAS